MSDRDLAGRAELVPAGRRVERDDRLVLDTAASSRSPRRSPCGCGPRWERRRFSASCLSLLRLRTDRCRSRRSGRALPDVGNARSVDAADGVRLALGHRELDLHDGDHPVAGTACRGRLRGTGPRSESRSLPSTRQARRRRDGSGSSGRGAPGSPACRLGRQLGQRQLRADRQASIGLLRPRVERKADLEIEGLVIEVGVGDDDHRVARCRSARARHGANHLAQARRPRRPCREMSARTRQRTVAPPRISPRRRSRRARPLARSGVSRDSM